MKKLGYAGIPLTAIGSSVMIGGLVMFTMFYVEYSLADYYRSIGGYSNELRNYLLAMLGVSIASIGELLLMAGIALMAVGFSVSKYYLKKENKKNVSFIPYFDSDQSSFKTGIRICL